MDENNLNRQAVLSAQANLQTEQPVAGVVVEEDTSHLWNVALLVLLFLTFFTPLGAVLFLPLLVVGFVVTFKRTENKAVRNNKSTNPIIILINVLVKVATIIILGIMALIAFFFIAFSTGAIELDMGS